MKNLDFAERDKTALLLIDCQEKLFPKISKKDDLLKKLAILLRGFQILKLPTLVTEQYPQGIGKTIPEIRDLLKEKFKPYSKTAFSCFLEPPVRKQILKMNETHWVLAGIETHVCVLQTAKDLISAGKKVIILSDATSSRNPQDSTSAIEEAKDIGCRISTVETLLFELLRDAQAKEFKDISLLIK